MNLTDKIQKYELKVYSIIKDIASLQADIERQEGIKYFCQQDPAKFKESIKKFKESQRALADAMGFLLLAGNKRQPQKNLEL